MDTPLARISSTYAATVILAVGMVTGCTPFPPSQTASPSIARARPTVVATSTVLCDMVKEIAAETLDLTCLLKPGVDGHLYEPVPADRKAIETAQLILYSGYGFEPRLIKLIQATSNPAPKVAVAEAAVPKPLMGENHGGENSAHNLADTGKTTAGQTPDPHVWQDATNGVRMVDVVKNKLATLVPDQAEVYTKNAQTLQATLTQIDRWIASQIATIPANSRRLVTTHDALGYYAHAYKIPVEGALQGISTEEKPTAARIKQLVGAIQQAGVPTIFAEVAVNPTLIKTVAKEARVKLCDRELFSDSLGEPGSGAETYPTMLIANTQTIVAGLGGTVTPFRPAATKTP